MEMIMTLSTAMMRKGVSPTVPTRRMMRADSPPRVRRMGEDGRRKKARA